MAFKLTAYQGQSANLTDNGTIASIVGANGSFFFIKKNFNDPNKRVALLLKDDKGNSGIVSCSAQLSAEIRNGKITKDEIAGLSLLTNEDGITFVSMPSTGALQEIKMADVKVKSYERTAQFLPEELIAL